MDQHQIQKAYLKNFSKKNMLWVFDKDTGLQKRPETTNSRTIEKDFQSFEKEESQNINIETPGINSLRKLLAGKEGVDENDVASIVKWVSLHSLRNPKTRKHVFPTKEEHEREFDRVLSIEQSYINKMNFFDIATCSGDDYFITSDAPLKEVVIQGDLYFILPLSPKKTVVLTTHGKKFPIHNEWSFSVMANSMQLGGCDQECYSDRKEIAFHDLKRNAIKLNLKPTFETMQFKI